VAAAPGGERLLREPGLHQGADPVEVPRHQAAPVHRLPESGHVTLVLAKHHRVALRVVKVRLEGKAGLPVRAELVPPAEDRLDHAPGAPGRDQAGGYRLELGSGVEVEVGFSREVDPVRVESAILIPESGIVRFHQGVRESIGPSRLRGVAQPAGGRRLRPQPDRRQDVERGDPAVARDPVPVVVPRVPRGRDHAAAPFHLAGDDRGRPAGPFPVAPGPVPVPGQEEKVAERGEKGGEDVERGVGLVARSGAAGCSQAEGGPADLRGEDPARVHDIRPERPGRHAPSGHLGIHVGAELGHVAGGFVPESPVVGVREDRAIGVGVEEAAVHRGFRPERTAHLRGEPDAGLG